MHQPAGTSEVHLHPDRPLVKLDAATLSCSDRSRMKQKPPQANAGAGGHQEAQIYRAELTNKTYCRTHRHEGVTVVDGCVGGAQVVQHGARVADLHERRLVGLQQRQRHPVQDLGALAQQRVPHPHGRLRRCAKRATGQRVLTSGCDACRVYSGEAGINARLWASAPCCRRRSASDTAGRNGDVACALSAGELLS